MAGEGRAVILAPGETAHARAAQTLREGGVVAHPTETVYGLAVDPFSNDALRRLFEVKGRPDTNPVLLIVADASMVARVADEISPAAARLMETFWPGPLSLVLPAREGLPDALTAGSGGVCVRCPGCEIARALSAAVGGPITSTSANISGSPPATRVADAMLPGVALGIDGGELPPATPSTIYDTRTGAILREGPISREDIECALRD